LSIAEVDELLTELASHSGFSAHVVRHSENAGARPVRDILARLYRDMPAFEAGVITQIILKDLRPILYPLATTNVSSALLNYNTKAVKMLSLHDAMCNWTDGGWVWWSYVVLMDFNTLGRFIENNPVGTTARPEIGTRILVCSLLQAYSSIFVGLQMHRYPNAKKAVAVVPHSPGSKGRLFG
jgi:DNA ligase 4